MAYRFFGDTVTSGIDGAILVDTARGDIVTFTRSATYIAAGRNAHVLNLRADASAVIDGALYSGDGATIQGRVGNSTSTIRIGETGSVDSAGGTAIEMAGAFFTLLNAGQIGGEIGVLSTATTTRINNSGTIQGTLIGVDAEGGSAEIANHGTIAAQAVGIYVLGANTGQTIANSGTVSGFGVAGVYVFGNGDVSITNTGHIDGRIGVQLIVATAGDPGVRDFINHGSIVGSFAAFQGSEAADAVLNDGTMSGRVLLGGGNDSYDGSGGGTVRVLGGDGEDVVIGSTAARNILAGNAGDDALTGGEANDILIGGTGADTMDGGFGFDIVSYRDATAGVFASITIGSSSDRDELISIEGLEGSAFNDSLSAGGRIARLYGGAGMDRLSGDGDDRLYGGIGDDTYFISPGDRVIEAAGEGTDLVYVDENYTLVGNVENLSILTPAAGVRVAVSGNALANVITGSFEGDTIDGSTGFDTLTGGAGQDTFSFTTTLSADNVDTITDFNPADDTIAVFRLLIGQFPGGPVETLSAAAFFVGSAANDASDRVIYNPVTGAVFYDRDGTGPSAQVQFADLASNLAVTNADFIFFG